MKNATFVARKVKLRRTEVSFSLICRWADCTKAYPAEENGALPEDWRSFVFYRDYERQFPDVSALICPEHFDAFMRLLDPTVQYEVLEHPEEATSTE